MTVVLPIEASRIVGEVGGERVGPVVALVSGIHGNEPAGVEAARRAITRLREARPPIAGRVVAIAGNLAALAAGARFLDRDLNRLWTETQIEALEASQPAEDDTEQREQREVLSLLRGLAEQARTAGQPFAIIDLHTTSGRSTPFSIISDSLSSRSLALAAPVPLVLGLEETVQGTLLDFAEQVDAAYVLFEGGQHDDPATVDRLETAALCALAALKVVAPGSVRSWRESIDALRSHCRGVPALVEVTYRHAITAADGFRMKPGYRGFQAIARGEEVATDHRGPIRAPGNGLILLPLYQGRGDDGFFLGRAVSRWWLVVSRALRAIRLERMLSVLPGVTRSPDDPGVLIVDPRVARFLVIQLFHLAGFRRLPPRPEGLVFRRRTRH